MKVVDRIPPNNEDAEKGVIASILIEEDAYLKVSEIVRSEDFYFPRHRLIFEAIEGLFRSQKPIDVLTLTSELKAKKKLKSVGGAAYVSGVIESIPTSSHVEHYAKLIKEASVRREMIRLSTEINKNCYETEQSVEDLLNQAEKGIFSVSEQSIKQDFVPVSDVLEEVYENVVNLKENGDQVRGISTGFAKLDDILGGFQKSDMVVLAARPSVGKSSLMLDFARHAAVVEKKNVGIFSLEMSKTQLTDRLLSMQVGVGLWDLRMGKIEDSVLDKIADGMGVLAEAGIFIDDTPGLSILEMRTKCRRLKLEKGLDMVIIDYLQLMQGTVKENRVQEVSEISRFIKILAKEMDIPVIALAQLSRSIEQRTDRRPQLSDLRESGAIEQDADVVMFLQREETYNPDTERKGIGDLIVAKHRNGATGDMELCFVREQARFRQLETRDLSV